MALDREKTFANAERLLKQGKVREALDECRRLAEDAPKDLLMLNRVGDLLARSGRGSEAIVFYEKIAEQFSASGFYPKSIAILKKVLKVDPNRVEALVQLGDLNARQKLPGEARAWLLQAADAYLRARQFGKAREVYERLVKVEPESWVHPVRLAETRAAEGDVERAGRDLVALGERMVAAGRAEDAERTLRRAAELLPGRGEAPLGMARVHAAAGRNDEALALLAQAEAAPAGGEEIAGEILVLYEQLGAGERAGALLAGPRAESIGDDAVEHAMRAAVARGAGEEAWKRIEPLIERAAETKGFDAAGQLLDRLARLDGPVSLLALDRAVEVRTAEGAKPKAARAIETLIRILQGQGATDRVPALLDRLRDLDPASPLLLVGKPAGGTASRPAAEPRAAAGAGPEAAEPETIRVEFEAPAVPLNPADEEFVSGHLTEAEVFEKYGLHSEALAQLREVAHRFPGHVAALDKLVGYLRTAGDRAQLRDGLVTLAFARRASGDGDGARRAATEAAQIGGIEAPAGEALVRLGIVDTVAPAAEPAAPAPPPAAAVAKTAPAPKPAAPAPPAAPPAAKTAPAPKPAAPAPPAAPAAAKAAPAPKPAAPPQAEAREDEELEILFDDTEDVDAPVVDDVASEIEEEVAFYLEQGMFQDALARIAEARASGGASAALDALEARARAAAEEGTAPAPEEGQVAPETETAPEPEPAAEAAGTPDRLDEDDLSSIAAALEAEYGSASAAPAAKTPEPEAEPSVDEVFAAFKEHVRAEVDGGDYRTHYDLGIAYKEMGLVDDALAEFQAATGAPELYREACSMLGLIHWERGEPDEAIRWYRAALSAPGEEDTPLSGLRYDLAEILLATGDEQAAYDLYAQVLAVDPAYREVRDRVDDLKRRLRL